MPTQSVVASGKSISEVSVEMATTILISIEDKSWSKLNRQEYLQTVYECGEVLRGIEPRK
jgi:hypothetical protein